MFRKFWKTIKFFAIVAAILICFPRSILPRQSSDKQENTFEYYSKQNESETRLIEFRDNPEALKLKLSQLEVINKSRKRYNASPVKLDILASRVANKMSSEAAEYKFTGHWNSAGEKPYHRYAFAGGFDHVNENAFGEWSSDNYINSDNTILDKMKAGHESFMEERAPNDGHKKNIIEKVHNFVGIGYSLKGNQFRYYEEFIDRYFSFENIPSEVKTGEQTSITVTAENESFLYFLIVYYEKFPQPMTPAQISRRGSYPDFSDKEYLKMAAWDLARYRNGRTYTIPLKFNTEGVYYIQIYSDKKEITKPGKIDTRGKTPYSGIVIKVNR